MYRDFCLLNNIKCNILSEPLPLKRSWIVFFFLWNVQNISKDAEYTETYAKVIFTFFLFNKFFIQNFWEYFHGWWQFFCSQLDFYTFQIILRKINRKKVGMKFKIYFFNLFLLESTKMYAKKTFEALRLTAWRHIQCLRNRSFLFP